jgi:O-antigen ligase/polysaccharide polymerase Wzy-like membrane protein
VSATAATGAARPGPAGVARRAVLLAAASVACGALAGELVASGRIGAVTGLATIALPVALWRRPWLAPAVALVAVMTVEQFSGAVANASAVPGTLQPVPMPVAARITSAIPLFRGIGAMHVSPADLLLLCLGLLALAKRGAAGTHPWPQSMLSRTLAVFLIATIAGVGVGLAHHGDSRVAFMEIRPFAYLGATYVLASVLAGSRAAVRATLWAIVLGAGLKATQGLFIFLAVRYQRPPPESIVGHEESLLFALLVFVTLALWLYEVRGPLRTAATWVLPLALAADLVNSRRSAWLVLAGGLVVIMIVAARALAPRRIALIRILAIVLTVFGAYLPAFWNGTGAVAQPARAVRSAVAPEESSARDAASDLYRVQENANLKLNIARGGLSGLGFGVPIDYRLPITDISEIDPLIRFIPHNGVLYVPMRMGLVGFIAFWSLIGAAIVAACRLARARDRELAAVGAIAAGAIVGYVLLGAVDQGFFLYRIAFAMGSLIGLVEAARRLADSGG